MKQWEYLCLTEPATGSMATLQRHMSEAGDDGWELVLMVGLTFVFKREKRMVTQ